MVELVAVLVIVLVIVFVIMLVVKLVQVVVLRVACNHLNGACEQLKPTPTSICSKFLAGNGNCVVTDQTQCTANKP